MLSKEVSGRQPYQTRTWWRRCLCQILPVQLYLPLGKTQRYVRLVALIIYLAHRVRMAPDQDVDSGSGIYIEVTPQKRQISNWQGSGLMILAYSRWPAPIHLLWLWYSIGNLPLVIPNIWSWDIEGGWREPSLGRQSLDSVQVGKSDEVGKTWCRCVWRWYLWSGNI